MGWKDFALSVDDWVKINKSADEMVEAMEEGFRKNPKEGFEGCTAERLDKYYFECVGKGSDKVFFRVLSNEPENYMTVHLDYGHIRSVDFKTFGSKQAEMRNSSLPGMILTFQGNLSMESTFDFREDKMYSLEPSYVREYCQEGYCECHSEGEESESNVDYTFTCSHCNENGSLGVTDENGDKFCSASCLNEAHYERP